MVSVEFESGSYVVDENEGMVEVCLVKIGETTRSISVDITARQSSPVDAVGMLLLHKYICGQEAGGSIIPICSTDGEDFTAVSTTVTFAPDQDRLCVNIGIIDDSIALEPDREFSVTFTVPPDVETGPTSTSTVTVVDDDGRWYSS